MSTEMTILFIVVLGFLAFAAACIYSNYKYRKRMEKKIKRAWGARPDREYDYEEFDAISHFFNLRKKEGFYIDDITWNDLEMDNICMLMNNTWSCVGESYLYNMLRTPEYSPEELKRRDDLVEYFLKHDKERSDLQYAFARIGKTGRTSIFDYVYNLAGLERRSNLKNYICIAALAASVAFTFVMPQYGVLLIIASLCYGWSTYYSEKRKVEPYIMSCSAVVLMMDAAAKLEKIKTPEMSEYIKSMAEARRKLSRFKRNSFFFIAGGSGDAGGGLEKVLIDYINYTFRVDLIQFNTLIVELKANLDAFEQLTDSMGMLESAMAIASFRLQYPQYCKPVLVNTRKAYLQAENVYHPMIDEPVKNSISVDRGVLLTGSNASGKSTFLKTVAINAVLAQTVYTCMADSYEGCYYQIYTSMALRDDLISQESYYIVEIKSLKRILDHVGDEIPLLCFVDEVLRGTNTVERIAASSQILKSMARRNIMCFAATHDIELTSILESDYNNYHFQEEVKEDDILFNYRLYEGRATSRNAIKLLGIIGYSPDIIKKAEHSAEQFVETGEWSL